MLYAADDYTAIRMRLEELRRQRARLLSGDDPEPRSEPERRPGLLQEILLAMSKL
jgi:hypothetical protein